MITSVKINVGGVENGWFVVYGDGRKMGVPNDHANTECQEVLKWIAEGNTPEPADVIPEPTWKEKREARYKAEADPLYIQAMAQSQTDNVFPDFTAHSAKVAQIKADIPKVV